MFFTLGKIQKQLKDIKASIHRDRQDILLSKYIESDCALDAIYTYESCFLHR